MDIEKQLRNEFALTLGKGSFDFDGSLMGDPNSGLRDSDVCASIIKDLRAKLGFSKICLVAAPPSMLILCNSKPPVGLQTSLDPAGASKLMASLGDMITPYRNVFLVTLS